MTESGYLVGVDIGGTCTDCVVVDDQGRVTLAKAFSTPPEFADGIIDVLGIAAADIGTTAEELLSRTTVFLHGTTVAENAILNRDLAPAGLIVTRGFEDTLACTRGGYGRWSGLTEEQKRNPIYTDKPEPLVERDSIIAVRERTASDGTVLEAVDEREVEEAASHLTEQGAEAIGVCLLWGFRNPTNERIVASIVRRAIGERVFLTVASEISPRIGEYERTSTVALNAGLGPVVRRYLADLHARLSEAGLRAPLLVMQAHGGVVPVETAMARPAGLIESGPVGALMGCAHLGAILGTQDIIAADMGGTTFKVGVVRDGEIDYQREPRVVRYHYSLSKMDVESLGVAGGSIVWVDERSGAPQVGPRSAGSYPGPVCYSNGGSDPTVTDVDAVLGYLNSAYFLGGQASLDIDAARSAVERDLAAPLDLPADEAAAAVYRLTNSLIYDLLHKVTVQRGLDPRVFALFSCGGTAGMHLPIVGHALGVKEMVIPYTASVQSALGLVTSDVVHEELITRPMKMPVGADEVDAVLRQLLDAVTRQLSEDGFRGDHIEAAWSVDVRFRRQVHILTVPVEVDPPPHRGGRFSPATLERLIDRFEEMYTERYGPESAYREAGVELVSYRARGVGRLRRPRLTVEDAGGASEDDGVVEMREVFIPGLDRFEEVRGYSLDLLRPDRSIEGPCVIWTPITTVVLDPGQAAVVDRLRNLRVNY